MSSKKNKVVADVVLSKENISLIVESVVSSLLNSGVLNSKNLDVVADSESVKADKKKVDLCYKKLVAKEKVPYCKPYKLVLNNLNLLKKADKEKFLELHQACLDADTLENNKKRKDFAHDLVIDAEKYPKLNKLFVDACCNYKNYKNSKNKGAKK